MGEFIGVTKGAMFCNEKECGVVFTVFMDEVVLKLLALGPIFSSSRRKGVVKI